MYRREAVIGGNLSIVQREGGFTLEDIEEAIKRRHHHLSSHLLAGTNENESLIADLIYMYDDGGFAASLPYIPFFGCVWPMLRHDNVELTRWIIEKWSSQWVDGASRCSSSWLIREWYRRCVDGASDCMLLWLPPCINSLHIYAPKKIITYLLETTPNIDDLLRRLDRDDEEYKREHDDSRETMHEIMLNSGHHKERVRVWVEITREHIRNRRNIRH